MDETFSQAFQKSTHEEIASFSVISSENVTTHVTTHVTTQEESSSNIYNFNLSNTEDEILSFPLEAYSRPMSQSQDIGQRRENFEEIVMQGDVLAPLISSLQVDTFGKECLEEKKHLFFFKDIVPIGPLGMVDDLLTISECGYKTELINQFINCKTGSKRLQFGTEKCIKMHIGKSNCEILCKDLHVGSWKSDIISDPVTGECSRTEFFNGYEKMKE